MLNRPPSADVGPATLAQRFRVTTLRLSAGSTLVLSVAAYLLVGEIAAAGVLLGGIAGVLGFRMLTGRFERLTTTAPERLHATMVAGAYVRLGVYAAALISGYYLDPTSLHGLFGALAGVMVVRLVPVYSAIVASRGGRRA